MRSRGLLTPLLIAVLPFFFLDIEPGPKSAVVQLYGFAHYFFFALAAWWLSGIFDSPKRSLPQQIFLIIIGIIFTGGPIELIQPFFGRDAEWRDLEIDILGGLFGIAFWVPARHQMRRSFRAGFQIAVLAAAILLFYAPVSTLLDMAIAEEHYPVLGDFETHLEAERWSSGEIVAGIACHGMHSLKVDLGIDRKKTYHGTTLLRSFGDWRSYTTLAFCLFNPEDRILTITVSIRDHEHNRRGGEYNDRFNRQFEMRPGWNNVAIPIVDILNAPLERNLELDDLSEVVIFTVDPPEPRQMYLDYVRLIR